MIFASKIGQLARVEGKECPAGIVPCRTLPGEVRKVGTAKRDLRVKVAIKIDTRAPADWFRGVGRSL